MSNKRIGMTEVILWISVILLILLALTPYALGYKVKSDYSNLLTEFSEVFQVEVELVEYNQGIFSSDAMVSVKFPGMPEAILFKEEIVHGPVYFSFLMQGKSPFVAAVINGQLDVPSAKQDMLGKLFADDNPLVYQSVVSFTGDVTTQAYIPAINTSFEDDFGIVTIQSSGAIINEHYSSADAQLQGDVQFPVLKIQSALFAMNTESLTLSFTGGMGSNQIMLGDSVISMNLLDIDSGEDQFSIRDVTIRSVTSENGHLINSGTQFSAREILASNQKFGPVKFNLSLNGINAQSLIQIQDIQKQLEEKLDQGVPPDQVNEMMTGQIMGIVPDLIKQAEIRINPLSVNSELGKLEADMEFMLEGIDENTPADPMFLLGAISLDLNVSVDEQLLKQFISWELQSTSQEESESAASIDKKVAENIQGMQNENWLIRNNGVYTSAISMHQGELLINGKSVDPMKQIMSSMGEGGDPAGMGAP